MNVSQIFLSYMEENEFEADLFQASLESLLSDTKVKVWTYRRDQTGDQTAIARSLREQIKRSQAAIMLMSQYTLQSGATQWMELAYADAFEIPTFVLLHQITFEDVKKMPGVPPLLLERQCVPAVLWRSLETDFRRCLPKGE